MPLLHFHLKLPFNSGPIGVEKSSVKVGCVFERKGSSKAALDNYLYRSTIYYVTQETPRDPYIVPSRQRKLFRAPEGQ